LGRQKPGDLIEAQLKGPLILLHDLPGGLPHLRQAGLIQQQLAHPAGKVVGILDPDAPFRCNQEFSDLRAMVGMGPEEDRLSPHGGLEQIVTPDRDERPPDERNRRFLV
jgi:hypothetical protein